MICKFCGHECKKDGHQANGTQRYKCKHCHRKQQEGYKYNAYSPDLDKNIVLYTKEVVSFNIGARTNTTLSVVTETLHIAEAKRIYTDKLRNYKSLIDKSIHRTTLHGTNHIERHNLTLRTHLKRLTRKSICYSRSSVILYAVLKIYFWG